MNNPLSIQLSVPIVQPASSFVLFGLLLLLLPSRTTAQIQHPFTVELSTSILSSNFGVYGPRNTPLDEIEVYDPANQRIGVYYSINQPWQIGLTVTTNRKRSNHTFFESILAEDQWVHPWGEIDTLGYSYSREWIEVQDYYVSLQARRRLLHYKGLELTGIAGFSLMRVKFWRNITHVYEYTWDPNDDSDSEGTRTVIPGIEGGLSLRYRSPQGNGVFVNGSMSQGFSTVAASASTKRLSYASLEAGVSISLTTPTETKRRNTILFGIGNPFSISYERLLFQHKRFHHSARAFIAGIPVFDDFLGIAYNVKYGIGRHHFLLEIPLTFYEAGEPGGLGINAGYEFRGYKGLVLRATGGGFRYTPRGEIVPALQVHVGFAI